jgi:F-type H+-transporting ATPase subunit a
VTVELGPDATVVVSFWGVEVTRTLVDTWILVLVMVLGSRFVTRRISDTLSPGRAELALELVVEWIRGQIRDAADADPDPYLPFVGTIFLFVAGASLLGVVPGYTPPTASLSTTAALAAAVFFAVPLFGIAEKGWRGYLRSYVRPTPLMLPFHVVGELSRTLALAVRLFGNIMSGQLVVAIVVSVVPFFFPVALEAFGLLIGMIQAYVFAVLALVYVISAARTHGAGGRTAEEREHGA